VLGLIGAHLLRVCAQSARSHFKCVATYDVSLLVLFRCVVDMHISLHVVFMYVAGPQDTELLLWEVSMDEITVVPGSRAISTTSSAPLHLDHLPFSPQPP